MPPEQYSDGKDGVYLGCQESFNVARAVKHRRVFAVVLAVGHKIADALELPTAFRLQIFRGRFGVSSDFLNGFRIEEIGKRLVFAVFAAHDAGTLDGKEAVVQTDFDFGGVFGGNSESRL